MSNVCQPDQFLSRVSGVLPHVAPKRGIHRLAILFGPGRTHIHRDKSKQPVQEDRIACWEGISQLIRERTTTIVMIRRRHYFGDGNSNNGVFEAKCIWLSYAGLRLFYCEWSGTVSLFLMQPFGWKEYWERAGPTPMTSTAALLKWGRHWTWIGCCVVRTSQKKHKCRS